MSFHRFDSSVAKAQSATDTSLDNQNAPARRLERLNAMSMGRSSGVFSSVSSEPFATPPFKAGSEAKRFQDETLTSLVF
jgi:hypothetical protein